MTNKPILFLLITAFSLSFYGEIRAQTFVTSGYNHVALSVKDLELSKKFYADVFGFEPVPVPEAFKSNRFWYQVAAGQELHLMADPDRTVIEDNNNPNCSHFAVTIASADAAEAVLKQKKIAYHRQQRPDGAFQIFVIEFQLQL